MADVQPDALDTAARRDAQARRRGAAVRVDVSKADGDRGAGRRHAGKRFGAPSVVFNNAGVGSRRADLGEHAGGLGVGARCQPDGRGPRRARVHADDAGGRAPGRRLEGHIVNTASMAGLVNPPNMGVYNVSKHAVVSLSETLYQDLHLVSDQVGARCCARSSCRTGITKSERNRADDLREDVAPTQEPADRPGDEREGGGQRQGQRGRWWRRKVFDALREQALLHLQPPKALAQVQTRLEDMMQARNPTDPFAAEPRSASS